MNIEQFARQTDDHQLVRAYEYDAGTTIAVDFGPQGADAAVDVADGTVIVVGADPEEQYELELPVGAVDAQAFMKNGVLTVELEDTQ